MSPRFILVCPEKPTAFVDRANDILRRASVELVYHPSIGAIFDDLKKDTEAVGVVIYEQDATSLSQATDLLGHLQRRDPTLQAVIVLKDASNMDHAFREFREVADTVTVLPTQEPRAVANALYWSLEQRRARRQARQKEIQQLWRTMALTFSRALRLRDRVTQLHCVGVMQISELIAENLPQSLKLPRVLVFQLKIGALMHDAGKIHIDKSILQKPGRLDLKEWEAMKSHPEQGLRDVLAIVDFPRLLPSKHRALRLDFVLRHLTWPLLVLVHHWYPPYEGCRGPYPEKLVSPECRQYLSLLGRWDVDRLDSFFMDLFCDELIPKIASGEQLRTVWAIIRAADIIDARLFPRPYHQAQELPSLDRVLRDLEEESEKMWNDNSVFESSLAAVLSTLRERMTAVEECLNNRGSDWLEKQSLDPE